MIKSVIHTDRHADDSSTTILVARWSDESWQSAAEAATAAAARWELHRACDGDSGSEARCETIHAWFSGATTLNWIRKTAKLGEFSKPDLKAIGYREKWFRIEATEQIEPGQVCVLASAPRTCYLDPTTFQFSKSHWDPCILIVLAFMPLAIFLYQNNFKLLGVFISPK